MVSTTVERFQVQRELVEKVSTTILVTLWAFQALSRVLSLCPLALYKIRNSRG